MKETRMTTHQPSDMDDVAEERGENTERLVFFSDAVFAIALTLLIIEIHVPEVDTSSALWSGLVALWPQFLGFVISFMVISVYWRVHHRLFRVIKRYDSTLISLNFLLLFLVAILPFLTALISRYGNWELATIIYDSSIILAGLVITRIWVYATSNTRLVDAGLSPALVRKFTFDSLYPALTFLIIIILTLITHSALAQLALLVLLPAQRLPFIKQLARGNNSTTST